MASDPRPYDQFVINTYSDYKHAMNVTTTDMFWGYSDKIIVNDEFKFDYYISHHSTDKKSNHAWLNGNKYDGVFLFSKKSPVSEEEITFRQLNEKIDHEQVASVPKNFERFTVETYEEYLEAVKSCGK